MAVVKAPVEGFEGVVGGVSFVDGVGETDNPTALAYFKRHGYVIESPEGEKKTPAKKAAAKPSSK